MKMLQDCFGRQVRLTDERLAHILEPKMKGMEAELERVLRQPLSIDVNEITARNNDV